MVLVLLGSLGGRGGELRRLQGLLGWRLGGGEGFEKLR
jgi:hypothetical protein